MTASKEQQRWSNVFPFGLESGALLEETHERSQAGSGTHHDDWQRGIVREVKR